MSLALEKLNVVQVLEPRVKISEKRMYAISRGGSEITYKPNISTSFSNSSISWSVPPPNPSSIVDRQVRMSLSILISMTGPDPGGGANLLDPEAGTFGPRAFPVSSITQTLSVKLNDTSVSIDLSDVVTALVRYHNAAKVRDIDLSQTPCMMDQFQELSYGYQTNRNPLAPYGSNPHEQTRGGFSGMIILTNTPTSATILLNLSERILLSPFLFGPYEEQGWVGLQTMDFNVTLGDLTRCFSYMDNNSAPNPTVPAFTTISASLTAGSAQPLGHAPRLDFCYITPQELSVIPRAVSYPYYNVQRYPSQASQLGPWVPPAAPPTTTVQSQNIQLNSIPRRVYVFLREQNSDLTAANNGYRKSDTFMRINAVSISWNNRSGLLSSATPEDLYAISASNGCNMSWTQWSQEVGSVLALDFAKDLAPGDATAAPGQTGTYQFYIQVNYSNMNRSRTITPTLYIVVISEGVMTIVDNRSLLQIGVISKADVLAAANAPYIDYVATQNIYGGSFFSNLGSLIGKVVPYVEKAIDIGKKVAPFVGPARMLLGVGDTAGDMAGDMDVDDGAGDLVGGSMPGPSRVQFMEREEVEERPQPERRQRSAVQLRQRQQPYSQRRALLPPASSSSRSRLTNLSNAIA